jgi:glucosamine--fructose-6-phosphate aminotransferase (isomerizing)
MQSPRNAAFLFYVVPQSLGFGLTHPIAVEGALKLKEITYPGCDSTFGSELKHGPQSAVHDGCLVLFITAPRDEMMISHTEQVTTWGGRAIALASWDPALRSNVQYCFRVSDSALFLSPIPTPSAT